MLRRTFVRTGLFGGLMLFLPKKAKAENPLRHPIATVHDEPIYNTLVFPEKARKVATYVITRDKKQGLESHKELPGYFEFQYVLVQMKIDGWQYNITAVNQAYPEVDALSFYDGHLAAVATMSELGNNTEIGRNHGYERILRDLLIIKMQPLTGEDCDCKLQKRCIEVSDLGLDGRCDNGYISQEQSGTGEEIKFSTTPDRITGLEHRDRFQKLYADSLDKLIQFYEA